MLSCLINSSVLQIIGEKRRQRHYRCRTLDDASYLRRPAIFFNWRPRFRSDSPAPQHVLIFRIFGLHRKEGGWSKTTPGSALLHKLVDFHLRTFNDSQCYLDISSTSTPNDFGITRNQVIDLNSVL